MLNSQPMGFYSPSQLVQNGKRHGVAVRAGDVRVSDVAVLHAGVFDSAEFWYGLPVSNSMR